MRERGLRKLEGGMLIKINSAKVPRIIGKGGSMVNMLKQETGTNIVVGQNGIIWVGSDNVEKELLAKKAIEFITEKPFIHGLTELVQSFLDEEKKRMKIEIKPIPQTMEDY
jgi:exosome complex component RRP4